MHNNLILKRKRKYSELDKIKYYPVSTIVAPMGYGKTTLLYYYLKDRDLEHIWLTLPSEAWSLECIWDQFMRQLSRLNIRLSEELTTMGFPTDEISRNNSINVIEDAVYNSGYILVIDDYHFIHSKEFHKMIEQLVKRNIKGFNIILLSRVIPDINFDELVLKGYCKSFDMHYLDFSEEDIKEYFRLIDLAIEPKDIQKIYELCEGWISAIYLISNQFKSKGTIEITISLDRILKSTLYDAYTKDEIHMLAMISVLDNFTQDQAVEILRDSSVIDVLWRLVKDNHFVRYYEHNQEFYIHNILSKVLRKIFSNEFSLHMQQNIYKIIGEWFVGENRIYEGLYFYLKGKCYEKFLEEFQKFTSTKILDNHPRLVVEGFSQIPSYLRSLYPLAYINYIGFYITNLCPDEGAKLLIGVEEYYSKNSLLNNELKEQVHAELEIAKSNLEYNDVYRMSERHKQAYKMLHHKSLLATKDKLVTYGSIHILYMYHKVLGEMDKMVTFVEENYRYYEIISEGCGCGFENQMRAEAYLEKGKFEKAIQHAKKAKYKGKSKHQIDITLCANVICVRAYIGLGNYKEVNVLFNEILIDKERCNRPIISSAYDLAVGYISALLENTNNAPLWLVNGEMNDSNVLYQGMGFVQIVYAKLVLCQKNYVKLEVICEQMFNIFSQFDNLIGFIHAYTLYAIAKYRLNQVDDAKESLTKALEIAKSDGLLFTMVEYGENLKCVIEGVCKEGSSEEFLGEVLKGINNYCKNLRRIKGDEIDPMMFTNREIEVLRLMLEGLRNKEIASNLYIAEITVKKHTSSIYRKLGVNGRTSAVKKCIELNICP